MNRYSISLDGMLERGRLLDIQHEVDLEMDVEEVLEEVIERVCIADAERVAALQQSVEIHTGASQLSDANLVIDQNNHQHSTSSPVQAPHFNQESPSTNTVVSNVPETFVGTGRVVRHDVPYKDASNLETPVFILPYIPFYKKKGKKQAWSAEHAANPPPPAAMLEVTLSKFKQVLDRTAASSKKVGYAVWKFSTRGLDKRNSLMIFSKHKTGIPPCDCICCNRDYGQDKESASSDLNGSNTTAFFSLPANVHSEIHSLLDTDLNNRPEEVVAALHNNPDLLKLRADITPEKVFDYMCFINEHQTLREIEGARNQSSFSVSDLVRNLWYNTNFSIPTIVMIIKADPNFSAWTVEKVVQLLEEMGVVNGAALWSIPSFRMKIKADSEGLMNSYIRAWNSGMTREGIKQYLYSLGYYHFQDSDHDWFDRISTELWRAGKEGTVEELKGDIHGIMQEEKQRMARHQRAMNRALGLR